MMERDSTKILRDGLESLERDATALRKLRLFALSELSEALSEEAKGSILAEGALALSFPFLQEGETDATLPVEYEALLRASTEDDYSSALTAFSVFLAERLKEASDLPLPWRGAAPKRRRICYVPSSRAEAAYAVCAKEKENVTVLFADNAEMGCAALAAGNADYLLLPYAGTAGVRLSSTEKLVRRYDLYTAAAVELTEEGGGIYGLFSLHGAPFAEKERMLLSLRFTADSYAPMGRMLSAISALGFSVKEFFSAPEDYGRVECMAVLDENGNDFALWLYLCLYAGGFSFLGRFPLLEAEDTITETERK